jgi:SAM-dependent methyltransferase
LLFFSKVAKKKIERGNPSRNILLFRIMVLNPGILPPESDPFGAALLDHYNGRKNLFIKVHSDASSEDHIQVKYLFRSYSEWPKLEKRAIETCRGRILEFGAGAGSHSLYLQEKGFDVTAADHSPGAITVMQKRGVQKVIHSTAQDFEESGFDTVLLLMNGIGLVQNIKGLKAFLNKIFKSVLENKGQLLFDSSDLVYLLNDPGSRVHEIKNKRYYGEVAYKMEYENILGPKFHWLFIDFSTLKGISEGLKLKAEKIFEDDHFAYLAKISRP